jgi:hypothetical protein
MKSIEKKGLCRLLPILSEPWENVSMDFMTQLPKCNRMDAILVVVDQLSTLAKLAPTKTIATIFNLAKLLFDMWVRHHGIPHFIVSDKNTKFMFRKVGMKLSFSIDAPPNSWIDSTMSSKVKTSERQGVGARSLVRNTLGVERHAGVPGWGLGQMTSGSIIHMALHKPNNKLTSV